MIFQFQKSIKKLHSGGLPASKTTTSNFRRIPSHHVKRYHQNVKKITLQYFRHVEEAKGSCDQAAATSTSVQCKLSCQHLGSELRCWPKTANEIMPRCNAYGPIGLNNLGASFCIQKTRWDIETTI